jgi:hypothetical protein
MLQLGQCDCLKNIEPLIIISTNLDLLVLFKCVYFNWLIISGYIYKVPIEAKITVNEISFKL